MKWIQQHVGTIPVLLEHHVDPNVTKSATSVLPGAGMTPLMVAPYECARLLIAAGADVNKQDGDAKTPLMYSYTCNLKKYRLLLDHGADINAQDRHGNTALTYSVGDWHDARSIRYLLDSGARLSRKDRAGKSILLEAHRRGDPKILHLLEAKMVE